MGGFCKPGFWFFFGVVCLIGAAIAIHSIGSAPEMSWAVTGLVIAPLLGLCVYSVYGAKKCKDDSVDGDDRSLEQFAHKDGPSCGPIPGTPAGEAPGIAGRVNSSPVYAYTPPVAGTQPNPNQMIQPQDSVSPGAIFLILGMTLIPCVGCGLFYIFSQKKRRRNPDTDYRLNRAERMV